jgi:long-chain acyl-CoA synthetase
MNVANFLDDHIARLGEVPNLVFEDAEYTNVWIRENANRLANGLKTLGVGRGDVVVVSLQNSPTVLVAFQAVFRLGATILPIMFNLGPDETQFILSDCDAEVLITSQDLPEKLRTAAQTPGIRHIVVLGGEEPEERIVPYEKLVEHQSNHFDMEEMNDDDIALLIYTAGTTGRPKGVMLSHGNLYHHVTATYNLFEHTRPAGTLICLPLAHMFGVTGMLIDHLSEHRGSRMVLMRWFDPEEIFRLIEKYKVIGMGGVPTMFWILLEHPSVEKYDISSMERCVVGAAPLPDELYRRFESKLGIEMIEAYGLSESCSAVACTHDGWVRKTGSAGTAIGKAVIKIFDEQDKELPPGEPGEIVIQGPTIMKGYYKRPEETAETLRGGWLHTGEVGYLDVDGYLFITDRKKDMIIKGGENIYPSEVENYLLRHPTVAEAAVVGVPDKTYGEEVLAFVVTKPGAGVTADEIISHCHRGYSKFKSPSRIEFVEKLPKSLVGKVLKAELKKLL